VILLYVFGILVQFHVVVELSHFDVNEDVLVLLLILLNLCNNKYSILREVTFQKIFHLALSVLDAVERLVEREREKKEIFKAYIFSFVFIYCFDIYLEYEAIAGPLKFIEFSRSAK